MGAPYNVDSFTGKPDQIVSDEYDFPAREEHGGQGRWVSPDPMRGTGNKYVYADNNPLSKVDIYGLQAHLLDKFDFGFAEWESNGSIDPGEVTSAESAPVQGAQTNATPNTSQDNDVVAEVETPQVTQLKEADANTKAGQGAQPAQNQSSGCGWCQKLVNGVRGAGWKTDQQIAQEAINSGEPPNGEYSFVFVQSEQLSRRRLSKPSMLMRISTPRMSTRCLGLASCGPKREKESWSLTLSRLS